MSAIVNEQTFEEMQQAEQEAQREAQERREAVEQFEKDTQQRATRQIDELAETAERRKQASLDAAKEQEEVDTSQFAWESEARKEAGTPPYLRNLSGLTESVDGVGIQTGEARGVNRMRRVSNGGLVEGQPRSELNATEAGRKLAQELEGDSARVLRPQASGEPTEVAARVQTPSRASQRS